jgi:hypothetical protein
MADDIRALLNIGLQERMWPMHTAPNGCDFYLFLLGKKALHTYEAELRRFFAITNYLWRFLTKESGS